MTHIEEMQKANGSSEPGRTEKLKGILKRCMEKNRAISACAAARFLGKKVSVDDLRVILEMCKDGFPQQAKEIEALISARG